MGIKILRLFIEMFFFGSGRKMFFVRLGIMLRIIRV